MERFRHVGKEGEAFTSDGERVGTRWAIADVFKDILSSHDADLNAVQGFPAAMQGRARDRFASGRQADDMAADFRPAALGENYNASDGAPIVGPDGIAESARLRISVLRRLYRDGKAGSYREWLEKHAADFGLTPEQARAEEAPVLIRVRTTPTADRVALAKKFDVPTIARMSASESARADADRLTPALLARFQPGDDGLSILAARNRDFVSAFLATVPANERGELLDEDGRLSKDGRKRIENALLGKAYGKASVLERITESTDDNTRLVSGALLNAAPAMAKLRGEIESGAVHADVDPAPAIVEAVEKLSWLRETSGTVESYLQQGGLFGEEMTPAGREMLKAFDDFKRSGRKLTSFLTGVAESAILEGDARQQSLLEDAPPAHLKDIVRAARRYAADGGQQSLSGGGEGVPLAGPDGPGPGGVPDGRPSGPVDRPRVSLAHGVPTDRAAARSVLLVERYAQRFSNGWKDAPRMTVVESETGLPDELRALAGTSRVEGVYVPKEDHVYLVAGSLKSREDVERVVLHEVMGHAGLRRVLGREAFGEVMDQIADSLPKDIEAKARAYGLDLKDAEQRREAADEVLAEWASRPEAPPRAITRAMVAIRGLLRRIFPSLRWTADDVRALLARARRRVEEGDGRAAGAGAPRFSRAQEGTDAFKAWFGGSKVVDEQGRPKVVYHETNTDFTVFRMADGQRAASDGEMPTGAFFKPHPRGIGVTHSGTRQMPVYLSLRNPLIVTNRAELRHLYENSVPGYRDLANKAAAIDRKWKADPRADWATETEETAAIFDAAIAEWRAESDAVAAEQKRLLNEWFQSRGYDGLILENDEGSLGRRTQTFVAFRPEQIKSATGNTGAFDAKNPDIRFSRAFDDEAPTPAEGSVDKIVSGCT